MVDDLFIQYDVLITSTRNEINALEKEVDARWLSRTGFVFDEMRTAEASSRLEIGERSAVVGNGTECIVEAIEALDTAIEIAGNGSFDIHTTVLRELNMYRYLFVYPALSQLKRLVSAYEIQPLLVFQHENPVTFFDGIFGNLVAEFEYMHDQFEPFVDELLGEFERYVHYTNEQSEALFTTLNTIQNTFNSRVADVQEVLASC